jgi:SAM-dependent methyltransferase
MPTGSPSVSKIRQILSRIIGRGDDAPVDPAGPYVPDEYWENRAGALIEAYDSPESWEERGWLRDGVEQAEVPPLLERVSARSALVVGAGSGRQYEFLRPLGLEIRGFDISPTLVEACQLRYPEIETVVDTLIGADERHAPMDAVLSTTVLQHIAPDEIHAAVAAVKSLARQIVVIRETTRLRDASSYQWAHDYRSLFADWRAVDSSITDENDLVTVELMAWMPPQAPDRSPGGIHSTSSS